ncbi:hypothetical protein [Deinococcus roseus]|uniref:Uncharacterized protein n=1 Tax=Deinococcus roseus TaxID=392414 RepID=A0ABQ2DFK1_9DEIO|nr:hypothetical protein [Deinococcus roseus]GGJ55776.1 hypothetical protein GCM10008938_47460 [Deinococcus roseus]
MTAPTTSPAFERIEHLSKTTGFPIRYREDLDLDRITLQCNPQRFVWILRESGTDLLLYQHDTRADYHLKVFTRRPIHFFIHDNHTLTEVSAAEAAAFVHTLPLFAHATPGEPMHITTCTRQGSIRRPCLSQEAQAFARRYLEANQHTQHHDQGLDQTAVHQLLAQPEIQLFLQQWNPH